ncbi:MAG TPA: hypothetical protein VJ044_13275 [Candidatus Hodarchaeales archaeon]|nr:hypothetical protein [Candidatus Hodarchaeales archaeon]
MSTYLYKDIRISGSTRPCDTQITQCPQCQRRVRRTKNYLRTVDHLTEQVKYAITHYYCDTCRLGWPSIPPAVVPNLTVGLDVLGHCAYWHVMRQQSFQTLVEHLSDCHGIRRSERTLERYVDRFSLFAKKVQDTFQAFLQAYLASQKQKVGLYDEAFFSSRYSEQLCLSVMLLPDVRVIAGARVTRRLTQEIITETMTQFSRTTGKLDVLVTDLFPGYAKAVEQAYIATSLQFCVFHFFQVLHRQLVKPLAKTIMQAWYMRTKTLRRTIKAWFASMRARLPGKYQAFLEQCRERLYWCLRRRWPDGLLAELTVFRSHLFQRYQSVKSGKSFRSSLSQDQKHLASGILSLHSVLRDWESIISEDDDLRAFNELRSHLTALQALFQVTEEQQFKELYQNLLSACQESQHVQVRRLGKYLEDYQQNLLVYLSRGTEKTTSLLEQMFQRWKKTTGNNRGGHDEQSLQTFSEMFQFFWNTTPIKFRGEHTADKRSPLVRAAEKATLPASVEIAQRWWGWLQEISYHEYRRRVREQKTSRTDIWKAVVYSRADSVNQLTTSALQRATIRWSQSHTFQILDKLLEIPQSLSRNDRNLLIRFDKLHGTVKDLYTLMISSSAGIQRSKLSSLIALPRSTIYDALTRLRHLSLIRTEKQFGPGRGRPVVRFFANPLPSR